MVKLVCTQATVKYDFLITEALLLWCTHTPNEHSANAIYQSPDTDEYPRKLAETQNARTKRASRMRTWQLNERSSPRAF